MEMYTLENDALKVTVRSKSAELVSIVKKETNREYLWCGDAKYWGWTSPILFPQVGKVRDEMYTHDGQRYPMKQHGFARNYEFALVSQSDNELWLSLASTEETKKIYPFDFCLEIGYLLDGQSIKVCWNVKNTGKETMFFSIGAHPAFLCPLKEDEKQTDCYMGFATDAKALQYRLVDEVTGLISPVEYPLVLENGMHRLEAQQFDLDALVIEHHQTQKMFLAGADKKPYVTVEFDAPLFGVWSPAKKNAPFICIEPWYGRSDSTEFFGTLKEREYGNEAAAGETFAADYKIIIE